MVEKQIIVSATKAEWWAFANSLSDVLCWLHGYKAAQPEDKQLNLWGTDDLTTLNIKIKAQLK